MRIIFYIALAICAIAIVAAISASSQTYATDHLPAPQNVKAANADRPGKVTISWEPVPGAYFYRIGWTSLTAVRKAQADGRHWMDTFTSTDIYGKGRTSHTVHNLDGDTKYTFIVGSATQRYGTAVWSEWVEINTLPLPPLFPPCNCRSYPPPPPQTPPTPAPPTPTPAPPTPTEQPVATLRNGSQHRHTTP